MEFIEPTDAGIGEQGPMRLNQVWVCNPRITFNDHRTIRGNRHIPAHVYHSGDRSRHLDAQILGLFPIGDADAFDGRSAVAMARMSVARVDTGIRFGGGQDARLDIDQSAEASAAEVVDTSRSLRSEPMGRTGYEMLSSVRVLQGQHPEGVYAVGVDTRSVGMLSDAGLYEEHARAETMGETDDPTHGRAAGPGDRFGDQETGVRKRVLYLSVARERDKVTVGHDPDQTRRDAFRKLLPKKKVKQELV